MKHTFCIAWQHLNECYDQNVISLTSKEHIQRIVTVLRLKEGEELIMFNRTIRALCIIKTLAVKKVVLDVINWTTISPLQPSISLVLPLLKKTSFEEALYNATEHGVNHIMVYTSNKSQKNFELYNKERLEKIIIAAAEQSHNYSYPVLEGPYQFNEALLTTLATRHQHVLFLDPEGMSVQSLMPSLTHQSYALLIGPEGDLDHEEKALLTQHKLTSLKLTPTILRASQAAGTAVGLIRSLVV